MVPCLLLLLGLTATDGMYKLSDGGAATAEAATASATAANMPQITPHIKQLIKRNTTYTEHTNNPNFHFAVDWSSGGVATTLPIGNFSVCKLEAVIYPPDVRQLRHQFGSISSAFSAPTHPMLSV